MSFKTDLYDKLAATSAITDIVAAGDITQDYGSQASANPRLIYTKISGSSVQHSTGDSDCRTQIYQMDCVCDTPTDAEALAEALRSTFHAYTGTMGSQYIRHTNVLEAPDEVGEPQEGSEVRISAARVELEFIYSST